MARVKFDLCFADTLRGKAVFDKSLLERAGRRALASCIMSKILPTAGGTSGLNLINFVRAGAVKFSRLAQGEKPDKILRRDVARFKFTQAG